ncbi:MAG: hypothetical protein Q4F27_06385 [Desulfovibrionaceae bacterium]|nr:hypothetical protein [Desulfovibrionaceae bacterium]
MNTRKIREELGRAKASCQRRDFPRAVYLTISALKELGGLTPPSDLRSDIRTTLEVLTTDPQYKKECEKPVAYQPGKEREILIFLVKLYKKIQGQEDQEDYEATLQRKLKLDRAIKSGKALLAQKKISDAEACFAEALSHCKTEYSAYALIARALLEAGEYVRALGHLRNGLRLQPDDRLMKELAEECLRLRAQANK